MSIYSSTLDSRKQSQKLPKRECTNIYSGRIHYTDPLCVSRLWLMRWLLDGFSHFRFSLYTRHFIAIARSQIRTTRDKDDLRFPFRWVLERFGVRGIITRHNQSTQRPAA